MKKSNEIVSRCTGARKISTIIETDNPFTTIGLINAIIQDLNDIHQKIELIENSIILQNTSTNLYIQNWKDKENFSND